MKLIRLIAVASVVAVTVPVLLASPAQAFVVPGASVNVALVAGGFRACANGHATYDPPPEGVTFYGEWEVVLSGTSISTVVERYPDDYRITDRCFTVLKGDAITGHFSLRLTFIGVGIDVAVSVAGTGTWGPDPIGDTPTSEEI